MNAGIFLVATQGNIHALYISPKGLIMGMLLAITTCFNGVLPGPLLKKYPAESVCAWAMLIGGGVLAVFLRPWRIEAHLDMIVIVGFLIIVIVGTIFLGTAFPAIDILGFALILSTLFILNINSK